MKRILTILGFIATVAIICTNCKKSSADLTLQGNWELTRSSTMGGILSFTAGNGNSFKFQGNNYSRYINGTLVSSGRYSIVKDDSASVSRLAGHITFEDPPVTTNWFYLQDDNTLVIDFGSAVDGPINTYKKR
jgi:hypothetical protein